MANQINIVILLAGALQGWLLSIWFFKHHRRDISHIYIVALLAVVSLQLTSKVISKGWLMTNTNAFYFMSYQFPYLAGPLIYLYIRSLKQKRLSPAYLVHFLPFIIFTLIRLAPLDDQFAMLRMHPYTVAILQLISLLSYSYYALRLATVHAKRFVKIFTAVEVIIIITLALMVVYYGRFPDVRVLFISLTVLIYWVTFQVVARSAPFFTGDDSLLSITRVSQPKYAHSTLKSDEADRIVKVLDETMKREKLYLDSGLTIDTLAGKIKTSRHHLSQAINERLQKTYAEYVSDLRLDEACGRLRNASFYRFTIAAIALDSGFSSVSGFNEVFKKRFQTTPSVYREQALKKMIA